MMYINTKAAYFLSTLCTSFALHAGTMGAVSNFAGAWAGVGGSYAYSTISGSTNIAMISSTPSTAEFRLNSNLSNHMAPVVNAGYFYDLQNNWLVGIKGVYKYLGLEQFDQTWSGTFSNGTYQTAGIHTKLIQDFFLLANAGYQFDNWLVYAGAGPSIVTSSAELNGSVLPASSLTFQPVNVTNSKTTWGGAGQVGFEYLLPNRFTVDISYNFVATSRAGIPTIYFPTGSSAYTTFSQRVQILEQGINITVNKYFW